ncbi:MAG TPA: EAL domain-containing protein [Beijerinckiaceae bacterium]|nr:EAL domain-containing protein [Beijerinckiaceae bacterium]
MKRVRIVRLVSAIVALLLLAGAGYQGFQIRAMKQDSAASSHIALARQSADASAELASLIGKVGELGVAATAYRDSSGLAGVRASMASLQQHQKELAAPIHKAFIAADSTHARVPADLAAMLTQLDRRLGNLTERRFVPEVLELLSAMERPLLGLAHAAAEHSSRALEAERSLLTGMNHRLMAWLAGLALAMMVFLGALLSELNVLYRNNSQLNVVAGSLEKTKGDLETANKSIQNAYAELNLHNQILKVHDKEMRTQNLRFDAALNNMTQGLCMTGADGKLIVCNEQFRQLFSIDKETARPGTDMTAILVRMGVALKLGETGTAEWMRTHDTLVAAAKHEAFTRDCPDGRSFSIHHQPMTDGGWVETYEDITERRKAEEKIFHMAHHDALTGLPNRVYFMQHLEEALGRVRRGEAACAVLCLDLDRFKAVNDTLGHPVGDLLLKEVAARLRAAVNPSDVVARFGGDEFAILKNSDVEPEALAGLGEKLVKSISAPFHLDGNEVTVGTSVGIGIGFQDGASTEQLLKNADLALYHSKSEGRGAYHFFEAHMDAKAQARRLVETDLKRAIPAGELDLFYQPLVDVMTRRIVGFESLIRWRHAEKGMISPAEFIPIAEEVGLIIQIGEWALRRACATALLWPEDIKVSVNLSPVQFRDRNLVQVVKNVLAETGLAPHRLDLEITETALVQDIDFTVKVLLALREMGVQVSLDDFGTGYSSLSYLRSFPFDKIKIDQSFVRDLATRPDCLAIVKSVTTLGENLGMKTLAEGVEEEEHLTILRELGCQEAQGYLFSRPVPNPEALKLIETFNGVTIAAPAAAKAAVAA